MKLHSVFNSESDGVVSVRANKAQSGVSLIEIMLSPFILSVGILRRGAGDDCRCDLRQRQPGAVDRQA